MRKIVAILTLLLVSAASSYAQSGKYTVAGKVTETGGAPVYMAAVVEKETGLWAVTDGDGKFEIQGVAPGRHKFTVSILGYEDRQVDITVKGNVRDLKVELNVSSLALDEVVVTAKEGGEITTASKISKQTIEHIQPSSLTDVMQLLPGAVTENPDLTSSGSLSIRDIGTNAANAAGTALIVDGASFSNDANMQMLSSGTAINETQTNATSTAGAGVDSRQVSTDNIESVEIIRGIPSVVYGDLTSGAVVVKTKAGVTPWEVRLKVDPKLKQVFAGKGFKLGGKGGVINFDVDYANAYNDVRTKSSAYNRFNFQVGYSNNFNRKVTFNVKLRGNWSNATNASDPDLLLDNISQQRDRGLRLNVNGKWIINKPWLTNIEYLAAGSITDQKSRDKTYHGTAGYTPATSMMETGEALAFFTDPQYYSDVNIYGLPVDAQARITLNQFGKWGNLTNKVLLGGEWKMQGNLGRGKVFAIDCPPSPGSASAYRERAYSDIPLLHRFTGFIEDNIKLPIGRTTLEIQAGARFNGISASGINTSAFFGIEPRFNGKYTVVKKKEGLRELSFRGGWGISYKMPSMIYLYPEDAWKDMVSFSYNDFDTYNYGMTVMTTKRASSSNPELKMQQTRNVEAGIEFDFSKVSGSLVYFRENMTGGYGFAQQFLPMQYNRYGYVWGAGGAPSHSEVPSGSFPVYQNGTLTAGGEAVPFITDTTFMSVSTPVNTMVNNKWGIEFTLDIAQIKAINTAINISGAYMNIDSRNTEKTQKLYNGMVNGRTFPYVGIYAGTSTMSNGSVKERLSTNVRFVTHIPSIAMVVTLTAQMVFMDRTQNTSTLDGTVQPYFYDDSGNRISGEAALTDTGHTKFINPLYIMDREGKIIPFTQEMEREAQYENLILTTNTANYYLRQSYPFYGMLNIRLTKEFRKLVTVSFYANNFLNIRGRVYNSVTNYPSDKNTPIYFGAEVKISIK